MNNSIQDCYFSGWKKTFSYRGCSTRKDFWSFILVNLSIIILFSVLSFIWIISMGGDRTGRGGMILVWTYFIYFPLFGLTPVILFFPILSLGIRRMHDIGKSGWWFGGAAIINTFIMPIIVHGIYYLLMNVMEIEFGRTFSITLNIILNIIPIVIPLWLCCKPTQQKTHLPLQMQ